MQASRRCEAHFFLRFSREVGGEPFWWAGTGTGIVVLCFLLNGSVDSTQAVAAGLIMGPSLLFGWRFRHVMRFPVLFCVETWHVGIALVRAILGAHVTFAPVGRDGCERR